MENTNISLIAFLRNIDDHPYLPLPMKDVRFSAFGNGWKKQLSGDCKAALMISLLLGNAIHIRIPRSLASLFKRTGTSPHVTRFRIVGTSYLFSGSSSQMKT